MTTSGLIAGFCLWLGLWPAAAWGAVSYSGDVAPIFAMRCNVCHGDAGTELNVSTGTYAGLMKPDGVIVPGDPDQSILVQLIEGKRGEAHRMPLHADPLSAAQIGIIRRWISEGAKPDADDTPKYRLTIPKLRVRQADAVRIECRAPTPVYLVLDIRDESRILIERRSASPSAEPVSWALWPEKNWPALVSVELTILYAEADPNGASLSVNSGGQARSETGITRLP